MKIKAGLSPCYLKSPNMAACEFSN
jgi:hypothetical protein